MVKQTKRLYWLNRQLQAALYPNPEQMEQEFGIKRSQAFQDKADLAEIQGVPIEFSRTHGGWHYTEACQPLPLLHVTANEAVALRHTLLVSREMLGSNAACILERLNKRLGEFVGAIAPQPTESAGGAIRAFNAAKAQRWYALCETAVQQRQKLRISNDSPRKPGAFARIVHPYHLHLHLGEWFLLTFCETRQEIRTFLLTRLETVAIASPEAAFTVEPTFDLEKEVARAINMMGGGEMVQVVLIFDEYQARWTREREFHPTEQRVELPKGRLQVTFEAPWGDGEALSRRVLGYGPHVEVVAPPALRERVRAETAAMAKIYS